MSGVRPLDARLIRHARATAGHLAALVALGVGTAATVIAGAQLIADTLAAIVRGAAPGTDRKTHV